MNVLILIWLSVSNLNTYVMLFLRSWLWRKRSWGSTCKPLKTLRDSSQQRYNLTGMSLFMYERTDAEVCSFNIRHLQGNTTPCVFSMLRQLTYFAAQYSGVIKIFKWNGCLIVVKIFFFYWSLSSNYVNFVNPLKVEAIYFRQIKWHIYSLNLNIYWSLSLA